MEKPVIWNAITRSLWRHCIDQGPLLLTWINFVWDEITYPFPNFNGWLLICQNITMRVYGARIGTYDFLCSKTYSTSSNLFISKDMSKYHNAGIWSMDWNIWRFMLKKHIAPWVICSNLHKECLHLWDLFFGHRCLYFNCGLVTPQLMLGHGWLIISHIKQWVWLLIHAIFWLKQMLSKGALATYLWCMT